MMFRRGGEDPKLRLDCGRGPRITGSLPRMQRGGQGRGFRFGFDVQMLLQESPAGLELAQGHVLVAAQSVNAHQRPVGSLRRRVRGEKSLGKPFTGHFFRGAWFREGKAQPFHELQRLALI